MSGCKAVAKIVICKSVHCISNFQIPIRSSCFLHSAVVACVVCSARIFPKMVEVDLSQLHVTRSGALAPIGTAKGNSGELCLLFETPEAG